MVDRTKSIPKSNVNEHHASARPFSLGQKGRSGRGFLDARHIVVSWRGIGESKLAVFTTRNQTLEPQHGILNLS